MGTASARNQLRFVKPRLQLHSDRNRGFRSNRDCTYNNDWRWRYYGGGGYCGRHKADGHMKEPAKRYHAEIDASATALYESDTQHGCGCHRCQLHNGTTLISLVTDTQVPVHSVSRNNPETPGAARKSMRKYPNRHGNAQDTKVI